MFLKRLLLVHGRYSYNRTAFIVKYSFYKSMFVVMLQVLYVPVVGIIQPLRHHGPIAMPLPKLLLVAARPCNYCVIMTQSPCSFQSYCQASGASFLGSLELTVYNIVFTGLPVMLYVFDRV
jgi:magnesium-transporting ATPase (P-type)